MLLGLWFARNRILLDLIKRKTNLCKNTDPLREPKGKDASGPQEWPGAKDYRFTENPGNPLATPHQRFSLNICFILSHY